MGKDLVSIYATANRPELWPDWQKLVSRNDVELEIVFCGNRSPEFKLPKNFHFIHSPFKLAQCQAIAAHACTGNLMMNGVDDFEYTINLFDLAAGLFAANPNPAFCVLPKMTTTELGRDKDFTHEHWRLIDQDLNSPMIPQQAVFRRSFFEYLGGYSKIFVGSAQDQDLAMRMVRASGYQLHLMTNGWAIETKQPLNSGSLYQRIGAAERMLLAELWIDQGDRPHGFGGKARECAAGPHQTYDYKTIQTVEQGTPIDFVARQKYDSPEWRELAIKIVRGEMTF